ncbi:MAG: HD domain-containing protein, partial [Desulfovibrio sp.]|nr:HD domain-containing protein [Desulfovibrio sp.]
SWIAQQTNRHLKELIILLLVVVAVLFIITLRISNKNIVKPIESITNISNVFAFDDKTCMEKNIQQIKHLKIRTGDEIENLYNAIVKMAQDMLNYINDIRLKNEEILKMQNALIITLADMVESRDLNTGQHIRKTAAYTKIILNELRNENLFPEILTDSFIEDVVNSAPLHDIGKINVPDAILNKPGKLTDEEFALMKTHTSVGGEIIQRIMHTMPDSQYLKEACNLATYHHEKWNGRGYPCGLEAEQIPLSARVMAVADVFDALVSRRSYKEGFPYEKAFAIIQEESGTHFDPQIVAAFFAVKDQIVSVADYFSRVEKGEIPPGKYDI